MTINLSYWLFHLLDAQLRPTLNSICIDNNNISAAPSAKNIGVVFLGHFACPACHQYLVLVSIFVPYLKYVNSWAKTQLSCSFMHLLFQELITVIPNYLAFLIMSSIDFNFQNSEARLVFRARIHDNVTPLLVNL